MLYHPISAWPDLPVLKNLKGKFKGFGKNLTGKFRISLYVVGGVLQEFKGFRLHEKLCTRLNFSIVGV